MKTKIFISFIILFFYILYVSVIDNPKFKSFQEYQDYYNAYLESTYDDLNFSSTRLDGYINGSSYKLGDFTMNFDTYKGLACVIYRVNYEIALFDQIKDDKQIRAYGYELEIPVSSDYYFYTYKNPDYLSNQLLYMDSERITDGENSLYFVWCKGEFSEEETNSLINDKYSFRIGDGSDVEDFCSIHILGEYGHFCAAMFKKENLNATIDESLTVETIPYIKEVLDDRLT